MDVNRFREFLQERKISEEEITASIQLAERFEEFAQEPVNLGKDDLLSFSKYLIEIGENTIPSYIALARYAYFTSNHDVYIAAVEVLDGAEAMDNFYQKAETILGKTRRDLIFDGVELPQLGMPNTEKAALTGQVMAQLVEETKPDEYQKILSDSLRDLDEAWYSDDKKLYEECSSLDEYLDKNAQNFIALLEKLRDEGKPFFTQFITDDVVKYVRNEPLIARGIREGNILYENGQYNGHNQYSTKWLPNQRSYKKTLY